MDKPETKHFKNSILSALDPEAFERLRPHLQFREYAIGETVMETGDHIDHVLFPEDSMASYIGETPSGGSSEIGVVGREGVVGLDLFLEAVKSPHRVTIQLPNGAHRLPAGVALEEWGRCGGFQKSILQFLRHYLMQVSQNVVCVSQHLLDERLARWLLMCRDRAPGDELRMTQEFVALMVAASRPSVSIAAHALQATGAIRYSRGKITIVDREALAEFACDCYRKLKEAESF